ncbi:MULTISPECIES: M28 family peptidase [unclassified Ruminococcus]|uniref:M28 family peptidase n=1 Tax=unclassified Ruminococcus TaxID=2608920 RepID=UPI002109AA4C|nr:MULTISPECIES: M28 family peptidase [unclassified Ruminococcus]MCQ4023386.1 M28 family peptidase [Ruminococcus sp. zg-924]MCQ4115753.1 M28 family peptidase [Ruminococcus sp. zg-921]
MNVMEALLEKYQVRKNRKQKDEFINFASEQFKALGYEFEINENPEGFKSRNLIVGDIDKAKVIFTAHYDTCARMPFPNFCTPLNPLLFILCQILIALPIMILVFGVSYFSARIISSIHIENELFYLLFPYAVLLFNLSICMAIILLMMIGPANKHTANDNTSGISTLFEIMKKLSKEQKDKAAFVFFDHEELGLIGSSYFAKCYGSRVADKLVVNFDCVSDGKNFLFACRKNTKNNRYYQKLVDSFNGALSDKSEQVIFTSKAIYMSDQLRFINGVGVAALNKGRTGLYLSKIHTSKDIVFDEENIAILSNGAVEFVNEID